VVFHGTFTLAQKSYWLHEMVMGWHAGE